MTDTTADVTDRCGRPFAHLPHQTSTSDCPGIPPSTDPERWAAHAAAARAEMHSPASSECPHAGCVHDAATPDAAHHLDRNLVTALQALAAGYGPEGVAQALEALWPGHAPAEPPVMGWRGGAHRVRDAHGVVWSLHTDNWWRSTDHRPATAYGALHDLATERGPLTVVTEP